MEPGSTDLGAETDLGFISELAGPSLAQKKRPEPSITGRSGPGRYALSRVAVLLQQP